MSTIGAAKETEISSLLLDIYMIWWMNMRIREFKVFVWSID